MSLIATLEGLGNPSSMFVLPRSEEEFGGFIGASGFAEGIEPMEKAPDTEKALDDANDRLEDLKKKICYADLKIREGRREVLALDRQVANAQGPVKAQLAAKRAKVAVSTLEHAQNKADATLMARDTIIEKHALKTIKAEKIATPRAAQARLALELARSHRDIVLRSRAGTARKWGIIASKADDNAVRTKLAALRAKIARIDARLTRIRDVLAQHPQPSPNTRLRLTREQSRESDLRAKLMAQVSELEGELGAREPALGDLAASFSAGASFSTAATTSASGALNEEIAKTYSSAEAKDVSSPQGITAAQVSAAHAIARSAPRQDAMAAVRVVVGRVRSFRLAKAAVASVRGGGEGGGGVGRLAALGGAAILGFFLLRR